MSYKAVEDVFGVSTSILAESYVDRGDLDDTIQTLLHRDTHIAIRGASKTGKSWLRQKIVPDAIIIQCRLRKTLEDIYREALGQLGIELTISKTMSHSLSGTVEARTDIGFKLIAKVTGDAKATGELASSSQHQPTRHNINDLDFVCELIKASERRLIVEDFHYLNEIERKRFAFDLKAMWDLHLYVIVIGVWSDNNLLLNLNPDLSGRVREISVNWNKNELRQILDKGSKALNLAFSREIVDHLVEISYGNAGILQRLTLDTLDFAGITQRTSNLQAVSNITLVQNAALYYAEELNSIYQTFARTVSKGIRSRKNSTGIYAHSLAVVLAEPDEALINGIPYDRIFQLAHEREPRIQRGNLTIALRNFSKLQEEAPFVLTSDSNEVRLVDHQLLLYRRFATVQWPWEELIHNANVNGEDYSQPDHMD